MFGIGAAKMLALSETHRVPFMTLLNRRDTQRTMCGSIKAASAGAVQ
jgi:hypothetical protein